MSLNKILFIFVLSSAHLCATNVVPDLQGRVLDKILGKGTFAPVVSGSDNLNETIDLSDAVIIAQSNSLNGSCLAESSSLLSPDDLYAADSTLSHKKFDNPHESIDFGDPVILAQRDAVNDSDIVELRPWSDINNFTDISMDMTDIGNSSISDLTLTMLQDHS
ncbi:MAG: hypothetical protein Q8S21_06730 [Candidatus Paracaedibacteraceae bacterium]|nr:hypothetical protein [Candidatus Paracaedibacteraceae bacterium]